MVSVSKPTTEDIKTHDGSVTVDQIHRRCFARRRTEPVRERAEERRGLVGAGAPGAAAGRRRLVLRA
jgi:hypothetical protein